MVPLRATPIASMIRGSIMCGGPRLACLRKEQILALWALLHVLLGIVRYLGLIVPLVDGFVSERLFVAYAECRMSPRSKGQSITWKRDFCT